ncbi:MAG TPA: alpha/beta hydrolase [Usitatibacter sp.]|nr:alpha/beta hydrolase [Usitatibacter sp.]
MDIARLRQLFPWVAACAAFGLAAASCASKAADEPPLGGKQTIAGPVGSIYVDDGGGKDGLPVVFLHSFGGDSSHWSSQLSHLRHSRRALAVDLRGHGKSAAPRDADYSMRAFVKDLEAVVNTLEIKRFVLVGHSLGGAVAAAYAAAHPGRVAGLVLVGAPGRMAPEQAKPIVASIEKDYDRAMQGYWEKLVEGAQPHVRTQVLGQMGSVNRDASLAIIRMLFEYDTPKAVDRYSGPKLVVHTAQGNAPHDIQNARPQLPRREMAQTSHWPHLDRPREFNEMLEEFLAGVK